MKGAIVTITMRNNHQVNNIYKNWRRQKKMMPLIVVTNGLADPNNFSFASLVIKGPIKLDKAHCINLAMELAKEEFNSDFFIMMDDDDLYGPNYTNMHYNAHSAGAIICGQRDRYIKTSKNRLWKLINCRDRYPIGCTMSWRENLGSWVQKSGVWGEEISFCASLKPPVKITWLPPGFFAQCRYNNGSTHAMQVQDTYFANCGKILDLGKWDEKIVNLRKSEPIGKVLKVSDEEKLPYGHIYPKQPFERLLTAFNH